MYIVIIGCGRMGSALAQELANEGHDVAIVDRSSQRLNILGSGFNGNRVKGIEFDSDVLLSAGIENANVFLAMTPEDNINIAGAQIARDIFKVPRVIARISNPQKEFIYQKLKLETICPTQSGVEIVRSKILDSSIRVLASMGDRHELIEITNNMRDKGTIETVEKMYNCRISSIQRNGKTTICSGNEPVEIGDQLVCMTALENKAKLILGLQGRA